VDESTSAPAFYALRAGGWRDYVTLLHPPYTAWHLAYVCIGWAVAPQTHLTRLVALLVSFFLAVGIGAHALDELNGRPLRTRIPNAVLWTAAVVSIALAMTIGFVAAGRESWTLVAFVVFGGFIVVAYNLELFGGRFHSDAWFAFSWGAFPALTAGYANGFRLTVPVALAAAACAALSAAQRALSTPVRALRRKTASVTGEIVGSNGSVEPIDTASLQKAPESALRAISLAMPLLAAALVVLRTNG
jgi:asparagine N-glycosylation enzyme membrane subunit Stt3